ncbi:uncharacterized protein LOC135926511 isoform X2 [Gordionus sp. m RMFG-2023]|uniref:uncharacterized protein LOC135926511 isoform X2 n=1 Tax=Gordionus sp. m RMFG-2023 TaxID=3053472 RepID=UPI0031FE2403
MPSALICREFSPNVFSTKKCQNCFRNLEKHDISTHPDLCKESQGKILISGYLFITHDKSLFNQNRRNKWQRRFFTLFDNGQLAYTFDENLENSPPPSYISLSSRYLDVNDSNQRKREYIFSIGPDILSQDKKPRDFNSDLDDLLDTFYLKTHNLQEYLKWIEILSTLMGDINDRESNHRARKESQLYSQEPVPHSSAYFKYKRKDGLNKFPNNPLIHITGEKALSPVVQRVSPVVKNSGILESSTRDMPARIKENYDQRPIEKMNNKKKSTNNNDVNGNQASLANHSFNGTQFNDKELYNAKIANEEFNIAEMRYKYPLEDMKNRNHDSGVFSMTSSVDSPPKYERCGNKMANNVRKSSPSRIGHAINSEILEAIRRDDLEYEKILASRPQNLIIQTKSLNNSSDDTASSMPFKPIRDTYKLHDIGNGIRVHRRFGGSSEILEDNRNKYIPADSKSDTENTEINSRSSEALNGITLDGRKNFDLISSTPILFNESKDENAKVTMYQQPFDSGEESDPPLKKFKKSVLQKEQKSGILSFVGGGGVGAEERKKFRKKKRNSIFSSISAKGGKNALLNQYSEINFRIEPSNILYPNSSLRIEKDYPVKAMIKNSIHNGYYRETSRSSHDINHVDPIKHYRDKSNECLLPNKMMAPEFLLVADLTNNILVSGGAGTNSRSLTNLNTDKEDSRVITKPYNSEKAPKCRDEVNEENKGFAHITDLIKKYERDMNASTPHKDGKSKESFNNKAISKNLDKDPNTQIAKSGKKVEIKGVSEITMCQPLLNNCKDAPLEIKGEKDIKKVEYLQAQLERTRSRLYRTKSENEDLRKEIKSINNGMNNESTDPSKVSKTSSINFLSHVNQDLIHANSKEPFSSILKNFKNRINNQGKSNNDLLQDETITPSEMQNGFDNHHLNDKQLIEKLQEEVKYYKFKMLEVNELADFNTLQIKILKDQMKDQDSTKLIKGNSGEHVTNGKTEDTKTNKKELSKEKHKYKKLKEDFERTKASLNELSATLMAREKENEGLNERLLLLSNEIDAAPKTPNTEDFVTFKKSGDLDKEDDHKVSQLAQSLSDANSRIEALQGALRRCELVYDDTRNRAKFYWNSSSMTLTKIRGLIIDISLLPYQKKNKLFSNEHQFENGGHIYTNDKHSSVETSAHSENSIQISSEKRDTLIAKLKEAEEILRTTCNHQYNDIPLNSPSSNVKINSFNFKKCKIPLPFPQKELCKGEPEYDKLENRNAILDNAISAHCDEYTVPLVKNEACASPGTTLNELGNFCQYLQDKCDKLGVHFKHYYSLSKADDKHYHCKLNENFDQSKQLKEEIIIGLLEFMVSLDVFLILFKGNPSLDDIRNSLKPNNKLPNLYHLYVNLRELKPRDKFMPKLLRTLNEINVITKHAINGTNQNDTLSELNRFHEIIYKELSLYSGEPTETFPKRLPNAFRLTLFACHLSRTMVNEAIYRATFRSYRGKLMETDLDTNNNIKLIENCASDLARSVLSDSISTSFLYLSCRHKIQTEKDRLLRAHDSTRGRYEESNTIPAIFKKIGRGANSDVNVANRLDDLFSDHHVLSTLFASFIDYRIMKILGMINVQ